MTTTTGQIATVTTPNNRQRQYRFDNLSDANKWLAILATFDPQTAASAVVEPIAELGHKGRSWSGR